MPFLPRLLLLALALALPTRALALTFTVDPVTSTVSLVVPSAVQVGFPPTLIPAPLGAQLFPGTGDVLPNGATSDGLTTFLTGTIAGEYVSGASFQFVAGSSIALGDSGTWVPGLPGSEGVPAAAALAASFYDSVFDFSGSGALRDATAGLLPTGALPVASEGGGIYSFGGAIVSLAGRLDFGTDLTSYGSQNVGGLVLVPGLATVEEFPGLLRLTLPLDLAFTVGAPPGTGALPIEQIDLYLEGQIVAFAELPEPTLPALLLAALAVVFAARARDGVARRAPILALLAVVGPLVGFACEESSSPIKTFDAASGESIRDVAKEPGGTTVEIDHTTLAGALTTTTTTILPGLGPMEGTIAELSNSEVDVSIFKRDFGVNSHVILDVGIIADVATRTARLDSLVQTEQNYVLQTNIGAVDVIVQASSLRLGPVGPTILPPINTEVLAICRSALPAGTTTATLVPVLDQASSTGARPSILRFNVGDVGVPSIGECEFHVVSNHELVNPAVGLWVDSIYLEVVEVIGRDPVSGSNPPEGQIQSFLNAPAQETTYVVTWFDADGDVPTFDWSGPDCGTISEPIPGQLVWEHTHPPCPLDDDHASVTVAAAVSDGAWTITCALPGAGDGRADCELTGFPGRP
jgi:hypothetical protein